VPAATPDVRTWTGDLIVRVMPGGSEGARDSSFTLYDGTRLQWNGNALVVSGNPRPRSIELRMANGTVVLRQIDSPDAVIGG